MFGPQKDNSPKASIPSVIQPNICCYLLTPQSPPLTPKWDVDFPVKPIHPLQMSRFSVLRWDFDFRFILVNQPTNQLCMRWLTRMMAP